MTKTKTFRTRRAFTMIELLVVIAIIAILAAILFPVFAVVREQARQSSTMSNMQAVYVGAKLYNEDEGHYPSVLFGYAEVNDTNLSPPYRPAEPTDPLTKITAMHSIAGTFAKDKAAGGGILPGYLYHEQIKDYVTFLAGDDAITDQTKTTEVYYPPYSKAGGSQTGAKVIFGDLIPVNWTVAGTDTDGCPLYGDSDLPNGFTGGEAKIFYKMDAMDVGPMLNADGTVVRDGTNNIVYELHYAPDWTGELWNSAKNCDVEATATGTPAVRQPLSAQLKYKNPPSDRTVLTYITSHVAFGNSAKVMVLLLSGTAKKMDAKDAVKQLPLEYGK